jgi:hypothetical protein
MDAKRKIMAGYLAALCLVLTLPAVASDPAREKAAVPVQDDPSGIPEELSQDPVLFANENGDFQILFPGGCGKLVTRANEPDLFGGEQWSDIIQVTHVYCDRFQEKGEGCSVTATFNLQGEDGLMAGPEHVTRRVGSILSDFGAKVVSQKAIKKDFGNGIVVEGVEVMAKPEKGPGEVWVRGLLTDGDIYILAAWNKRGGLWGNPDYVSFFSSFQPWTE